MAAITGPYGERGSHPVASEAHRACQLPDGRGIDAVRERPEQWSEHDRPVPASPQAIRELLNDHFRA